MVKNTIRNKKGEKIVILIEGSENNKGLVFIMHGMGYNKEEPYIKTIAEAFEQNKYTTVRFDTTNTFGESDGKFEDATITNSYEDLEDVINWSKQQDWYQEPFVIAGHSAGGLCTILFAEKYPEKVKAIAPISTVVSGKLAIEVYPKEMLEKWEEEGIYEWEDEGKIKRMKWDCVEDGIKYDALKNISALTMPVLMVVGENDEITPVKHQKILYETIPSRKELNIINGASHKFEEKENLDDIKNLLDKWIKSLD